MSSERIVLAYSGGLDTSCLIPWLKEKYGYDVVACLVDAGRVKNIPQILERARASGAVAAVAVDAKDEFAEHYCLPALMANALYEDKYPLVSSLSRPLIAHKLVHTAHEYGATAVAHGCTGKGNDQVRIDVGVRSQDPSLQIIAPARGADWPSREELLDYAAAHDIPCRSRRRVPTPSTRTFGDAATSAVCSRTPGWRRPKTPSSSSSTSRTRPTKRSTSS